MDVNAFMDPLLQVLAVAALLSIGLWAVRSLLSGAVEDGRDSND